MEVNGTRTWVRFLCGSAWPIESCKTRKLCLLAICSQEPLEAAHWIQVNLATEEPTQMEIGFAVKYFEFLYTVQLHEIFMDERCDGVCLSV